MSAMDTFYLVISMAAVIGISSILPILMYRDYRAEKKRLEALRQIDILMHSVRD